MAFFRLSSGAKCCHKHVTLPRIVFIFLALLSFLCGNAFGYVRPLSLASLDAKATHSTNQATLLTDHCSLTTSFDYGWDAKNQLVRARTKNHSSAAHAYDLTFTHDAEGRRVQKHVVEYQNGAVVSEKFITFVWDGWNLLYERQQLPSGLTTLERRYLWGPDIADGAAGGAGGLLLIQETKGNNTQKIIPLYDGTGHVTALTNLNKDLLASYAYGPFGEKIHATGPLANSNPWRWATKYFDEETGLYYFGKRYLDPVTGQWLSRELLGESESLNLYSYCHNDPVNRVDVLGLAEVPFDMEEKRRLGELFAAARELEMDILLRRNEATMNEAELHERQQLRLNYFLNKEYEMFVAERQSGQPEIKPDPSRPIQETAALCVGGATNEVNAGLNTVFISPVGAETFALKWLGICGSVIAKEARVSALLGSTASGVSRMQLLTAFGKELQFSAQVARSDAAFMQTAKAQELLRLSAGVEDGLRRTTDLMKSGGQLGGKLFPDEKIPALVNYFNKRGIYVHQGVNGAFDGVKKFMKLPKNPTVLNVKHEISHYLDWKKYGDDYYNLFTSSEREQMVLDRLKDNRIWSQLNFREWSYSIDYPSTR